MHEATNPGYWVGGLPGYSSAQPKFPEFFTEALGEWSAQRVTLGKKAMHSTGYLPKGSAKTIAITGSSGLVGHALTTYLSQQGYLIRRLLRKPVEENSQDIAWNPAVGQIDHVRLEGVNAVVHLAGESLVQGRWTAAKKERIRTSRVASTHLLSTSLAALTKQPSVLVCASAIGFYGNRGETLLDEDAVAGQGFLADVCGQWEAAAQPARDAGIRVVHLRIGVVLSVAGGALAKMLTPFKLGLGGVVGNGRQFLSWITLDDLLSMIIFLLEQEKISGCVNGVAPHPVTNREFTKTLGKIVKRPTVFPMPTPVSRLIFGEMADELLLASTRVIPKRLQNDGYRFRHPDLESALRHLLC